MFEPLATDQDSPTRLRRFAAVIGVVSIMLSIGLAVWFSKSSEFAEWSVDFEPFGYVESGLVWASLLGGLLAIGLYLFSLVKEYQLRK